MDLKQLQYFVAVAEEGGITAAARKLYMSQPPITAQIKQLEEELSCVLFLRGARSMRLTDEGRLLYERAKTMLELERSTREEIAARFFAGEGTLRLGVVSSVASSLLPGWLRRFHDLHPNIRFELSEENTYQLLEKLRAGVIEAALVRTPFPAEHLRAIEISSEMLVAAGRAGFFPEAERVTLEQLAHLPLLIYRRWERIAEEMFAGGGLVPRVLLRSDSASTIAAMAESGLGVGLLPQSAAQPLEKSQVRILPIDGDGVRTTITAVFRAHATLSHAAEAFAQFVQDPFQ